MARSSGCASTPPILFILFILLEHSVPSPCLRVSVVQSSDLRRCHDRLLDVLEAVLLGLEAPRLARRADAGAGCRLRVTDGIAAEDEIVVRTADQDARSRGAARLSHAIVEDHVLLEAVPVRDRKSVV